MRNCTQFSKSFLSRTAIGLLMITGPMLWAQQPTVKVPPACEVVVAGTGPGVTLGFGGIVGSGGVVVMPDPFDDTTSGGNFTLITNGTTPTGWSLAGDLSIQTSSPYNAAVQSAGATGSLNIQSYNKRLRSAEQPSTDQPLLDPRWGRSKGRISLSYTQTPCNSAITFDVYKRYTGTAPSALPPIVGPDCLLPDTVYTYSVDQIASDNAGDGIGFDNYYWSGFPSGSANVYYSADESSVTFRTGATVPSNVVLRCAYGRANPWDGQASATHTTFVTKTIGAIPSAPTFTTAPPSCLPTGSSSFNVTIASSSILAGYTYTWSAVGTSWSLVQSGTQNANVTVSGLDNNPGTLTLTIDNGVCLPAVFEYPINRNFVSPLAITGNTCVSAGTNNSYSIPSNALINNTTWTLPSGWSIVSSNSPGSTVVIQVPSGTAAGAYTLTARSTDCPGTAISLTVNVRPATPSYISPTTCVVRNGGPAVTYTTTASPGATSYSWTFPTGWTPATATTTTPTVSVTPGGTGSTGLLVSVIAIGASGCNSATASLSVSYVPITPSSITTSCFNFGVAGQTTVAVANAPSPFYGSYTVTSSPTTLLTGYSYNGSTGLITLNTSASAPAGTYNLTITHNSPSCGSSSATFPVTVAGNGASVAITANVPGTGNCDQYSVINRPAGSTLSWYVDGVLAVSNGTTVNIFGNALTLCGNTAPSSVCAQVTLNGCTTRVCAPTVGTHGLRGANPSLNETTIEGIKIYPNPNNGNFTISVDNFKDSATATVSDTSGKQIGTYTLQKGENKIKSEGIASGTYIVSLVIDGKTETRKIIIK